MTQSIDFRVADGSDIVLTTLNAQGVSALRNRAGVNGNPAVHTPTAATLTYFAGIRLTAKSSGIFDVTMQALFAAAAADVATLTVAVYTDAVAGTPLTLPANAIATGTNCFIDNTGAGIAPSAGATAATIIAAPSQTIGTAAASLSVNFDGLCGLGSGALAGVPVGQTFLILFAETNTVAARAITQLALGAFELP